MLLTRTLSDLREQADEISRICRESEESVQLTEESGEDLVMMSLEVYERLQSRVDLYRLLDEAEEDVVRGDQGISVAEMRERLIPA